MIRKVCVGLCVGFIIVAMAGGSAHAANCSAYTYTLTNGTIADADQVMSDFNTILSCGNNNLAPLAGPHFSGNVGIGTTAPATNLQITKTSAGAETVALALQNASNTANTGVALDLDSTGGGIGFRSSQLASLNSGVSSTNLVFRTSYGSAPTEKMRIDYTGKVGIGTATPSLLLFVNGTAGGTSAYQVVSDGRLKKDIQPVAGALALVARLNPVSYRWRAPGERSVGRTLTLPAGERQIGFIAQDVEKIVPEAVVAPDKGSDAAYSLKEDNLIPVLVAAIKEQQAEIEQLRSSLASLRAIAQR